jgi:tripartite-type tricarboxylate transporter receptor subunit TctC
MSVTRENRMSGITTTTPSMCLVRATLLSALALGLPSTAICASGPAPYPAKAVRIIVPYAAGGGTDVQARLIGAKLSEMWSQPVIIDNRPGGGTVIGTELVARSPADGYTLVIGTPTHVVNVWLYPKLPFDPIRDFEPITLLTASPNIFVVHPSLPVTTVKAFIALARARPRQISYGSSGNGGTGHLAMEMMKQMAHIQAVHVPYKGGGPAINAVLSGEVSALINNMIPTVSQVKAGRLRALGVTSRTRSSAMPEVPTIAESGLPGFEAVAWFGLFAPANTPAAIIEKLHADFAKALKLPEVRQMLESQGAEAVASSPREFAQTVRSDLEKWRGVVKAAQITAD